MKIAMLAPIAWRTPPKDYGPWELVTSLLTEELVKSGLDVTLFATGLSLTNAKLESVFQLGFEENAASDAKVMECLHISHCLEKANEFDLIHNQFDFLPLTYSQLIKTPMVTTIHGFSSPAILPVYKKYNKTSHYVSISYADRNPSFDYVANVYHGIDLTQYSFCPNPSQDYLLFMGRIHPDKGAHEAIEIAQKINTPLIMAGIIQDDSYFDQKIKPFLNSSIRFIGSIGGMEKIKLLQNAKAFLHPISFEEPFGLSVVEAMACGTPVIAYKKGSMAEVIEDGKTGFLVHDVDSALKALTRLSEIDRNYCHQYVQNNFSKERMAADYIRVYEKIMNSR